jgi:CO/xanthine dehydrogenase Mo-binding subunit
MNEATRYGLLGSGRLQDPARREFLVGAVAAVAGFALAARAIGAEPAIPKPGEHGPAPAPAAAAPGAAAPANPFAAYVEVRPDGEVRITCPQFEFGQGVLDSLPRLVADEMDADWARVTVLSAHADAAFVSPVNRRQRVGGSDSVMAYRDLLRRVGASARAMLVGAAAANWGVPAAECRTEAGRVLHAPSGRALGYGELAAAAASQPVPAEPALKPDAALRLVGRRMTRKDTPSKVDGSAVFGIDVREPGMLYAALRRSVSFGGRVARYDAASVASRAGVAAVVPLDDAVAVVADSFWRAKQAAEALDVEFDDSALRGLSSEGISASLQRALGDDARAQEWPFPDFSQRPPKLRPGDRGAVEQVLARGDLRRVEAVYEVPYLAHMTMEPQVCTVRVSPERCEVWAPLQAPDVARQLAARATGLPPERVRVQLTLGGGGFGRRFEQDSLQQALRIGQAVPGRMVKLVWTREQDMQHDFYRPAHVVRYRAALDDTGRVLAIHGRVTGQSIQGAKNMRFGGPRMADGAAVGGTVPEDYDLGARYADFVEVGLPVPIGFWRSVAASHNGFFAESFVDELAHAARRDPYEFRRERLAAHPRHLAVLERAAREAGWGRPAGAGRARGIAINSGFGGICAQVVEIAVRGGRVVIDRVTVAYDCGPVIDPGIVEAQLQGGVVFGLSAALHGEVAIARGGALPTNFHEQAMLRLGETPRIDVHLLQGSDKVGGAGESGTPPIAPALANAIFAATGKRLRRLPLRAAGLTIGSA